MDIHPIHFAYLKNHPANSVGAFLTLLDGMEPVTDRDKFGLLLGTLILKVGMKEPESVHETIGDMIEDHVSYRRFKDGVRAMAEKVPQEIVVAGVVHHLLTWSCMRALVTVEEYTKEKRRGIAYFQRKMSPQSDDITLQSDDITKKELQGLIDKYKEWIKDCPKEIAKAQWSSFFCLATLVAFLPNARRLECPGQLRRRSCACQRGAGLDFGWERHVGIDGRMIGMNTFGASAPLKELQKKFGFTADAVAAAAKESLGRRPK
jgi:hypothetical protein